MKISVSEFEQFQKMYPKPLRGQPKPAERFGQAWYNYFKLHAHNAADPAERALLDRIYNEPDKVKAYGLITANFIDYGH